MDEEEEIEQEARRQTPPNLDEPYSPSLGPDQDYQEEDLEERQEAQVKVYRMAIPLPSKKGDDLLRGVSDLEE